LEIFDTIKIFIKSSKVSIYGNLDVGQNVRRVVGLGTNLLQTKETPKCIDFHSSSSFTLNLGVKPFALSSFT
jgi:hypothetical protein